MITKATEYMWMALHSIEFKNHCFESRFTFTKKSFAEVWVEMKRKYDFNVEYFKVPFWKFWWRGIPAYTQRTTDPHTIFINKRIRFTLCYLSGILAHELAHLKGFGHGSNKTNQKGYWESVPLSIQKFVEKFNESL